MQVAIRQWKFCKSNYQVTGGIISVIEDTKVLDDHENNKDDKEIIDGISTRGGVIKFKTGRYDVDQAIREILQYSGDLVQKF